MQISLQKTALDIWNIKYCLKTQKGKPIDLSIKDSYERVAKFLSKDEKKKNFWFNEFLWAMKNGAIPAGRIISNAGAEEYKPATSLINCIVSQTLEDSIEGIFEGLKNAAISLKAGCGIGYEGSTLRPKGAVVNGAGATTTGALPFLEVFDKMCSTIASAGGRRGAQMLTFDLKHPDILELIKIKRETAKFTQFNISLLITDEFIEAITNDEEWVFSFPITKKEYTYLSSSDIDKLLWRKFNGNCSNYVKGLSKNIVACKVYDTIPTRKLWDIIMKSTYEFSDPGFLLIDKINKENNLWFCENIRTTNPCGEQPLAPNGACLLGSINLTKFITGAFTKKAKFNFKKYKKVIRIFTRLLDNVVDYANLPLPEQQIELKRKRRHGMGYLGLGSAMIMLGIDYGSKKSINFTEKVTKLLALEGWKVSVELAKEKGPAPIFNEKIIDPHTNTLTICEDLFCSSVYMQKIFKELPELEEDILEYGCRFTHHTSIAPTGTISLSLANNASNGIEPSFAHNYIRNVIKEGKATKETKEVFSYEILAYKDFLNKTTQKFNIDALPSIFKTANDFTPKQHIDVQAIAQKWIDSSISKTINVATDISYSDFKDIYWYAIKQGLKGCTTYRHNPNNKQGVLMTKDEQAKQMFTFILEDGSEFNVTGDTKIDYEGEIHNTANLFDALKGGYYGSF